MIISHFSADTQQSPFFRRRRHRTPTTPYTNNQSLHNNCIAPLLTPLAGTSANILHTSASLLCCDTASLTNTIPTTAAAATTTTTTAIMNRTDRLAPPPQQQQQSQQAQQPPTQHNAADTSVGVVSGSWKRSIKDRLNILMNSMLQQLAIEFQQDIQACGCLVLHDYRSQQKLAYLLLEDRTYQPARDEIEHKPLDISPLLSFAGTTPVATAGVVNAHHAQVPPTQSASQTRESGGGVGGGGQHHVAMSGGGGADHQGRASKSNGGNQQLDDSLFRIYNCAAMVPSSAQAQVVASGSSSKPSPQSTADVIAQIDSKYPSLSSADHNTGQPNNTNQREFKPKRKLVSRNNSSDQLCNRELRNERSWTGAYTGPLPDFVQPMEAIDLNQLYSSFRMCSQPQQQQQQQLGASADSTETTEAQTPLTDPRQFVRLMTRRILFNDSILRLSTTNGGNEFPPLNPDRMSCLQKLFIELHRGTDCQAAWQEAKKSIRQYCKYLRLRTPLSRQERDFCKLLWLRGQSIV